MLKVGVIGAGIVCERHLIALQSIEGVKLQAIADIVADKAQKAAQVFNMNAYVDYKEMVSKENLDVAIINLPHGLHKEASIFCMQNALHVFIEKPMANTVYECEAMIEQAKKYQVKLMIGHVQRYFLHNIKAKQLMHSGELGIPVMITDTVNTDYFVDKRPKWFLDKKLAGGGILMNYGAHSLDKLLWFTESNIKNVTGKIGMHHPEYDVEGNAQVFVELESGLTALLNYSGYKVPIQNELIIYLTKGCIKVNNGVWISQGGTYEQVPIEGIDHEFQQAFLQQQRDFIESIKLDKVPPIDGHYGKEIITAINKIYQQYP